MLHNNWSFFLNKRYVCTMMIEILIRYLMNKLVLRVYLYHWFGLVFIHFSNQNLIQTNAFWFSPNTNQDVQFDTKRPNQTIGSVWISLVFQFVGFSVFCITLNPCHHHFFACKRFLILLDSWRCMADGLWRIIPQQGSDK